MKLSFAATLLIASACTCTVLSAQENTPVYKPGNEVSLPELVPADLSNVTTSECDQKATGEAELTFLVDSAGKVHDVQFLHFIDTDLDRLALTLVRANRFQPARLNGSPVAAGMSVKIKIHGCIVADKNSQHLRLFAPPEQKFSSWKDAPATADFSAPVTAANAAHIDKVGGQVKAPVPLFVPEARYSPEARQIKLQGECMVSMIVNDAGIPENLRIVRPLGAGLDEQALAAVMNYRFKPAMKDGKPVPVYLTVRVNFRLRQ